MNKKYIYKLMAVSTCAAMLCGLSSCTKPDNNSDTSAQQTVEVAGTNELSSLDVSDTTKDLSYESTTNEIDLTDASNQNRDNDLDQKALAIYQDILQGNQNRVLGVAFIGHKDKNDNTPLQEWLNKNAPGLVGEMPFILSVPEDRIIGKGYGDLFCFIPRDNATSLSVNSVSYLDDDLPVVGEVLYRDEYTKPILVFSNPKEQYEKSDVVINATDSTGVSVTWYPELDDDYGYIDLPSDENDFLLMTDFTSFGDTTGINYGEDYKNLAEFRGGHWLPPTDLGIANTDWTCGLNWSISFIEDNSLEDFAGRISISYRENEDDIFEPEYNGFWRMEDDCIDIELIEEATGKEIEDSFPLLISPSGEDLFIAMSEDGDILPFFNEGSTFMDLTLNYG